MSMTLPNRAAQRPCSAADHSTRMVSWQRRGCPFSTRWAATSRYASSAVRSARRRRTASTVSAPTRARKSGSSRGATIMDGRPICSRGAAGQAQGGGVGRVFKPDLPAESEEEILAWRRRPPAAGSCGRRPDPCPRYSSSTVRQGGAAGGGLAVHAASGGFADLVQTGQQQGIEGAAVPVMEHGHGLLVGAGRLIAALVYQHIVGIGQGRRSGRPEGSCRPSGRRG